MEIKTKLEKEDLEEIVPDLSRVRVFELQKEKQKVMNWLRENLQKIDNNEGVESFTHNAEELYLVSGDLSVICQDGKKVNVTPGMLATDGEWGIEYKLQKEVAYEVKKKENKKQEVKEVKKPPQEVSREITEEEKANLDKYKQKFNKWFGNKK